MNLKEIRDDVRSLIVEPTPGFRSNEELNRWINQAHQELAMSYRIEERLDIILQRGVNYYDVPDNLLTFKGAWASDGKAIPVIPTTSGTDLIGDSSGSLTIFRLGDKFTVVPAPEEEDTGKIITIFYERTPKPLIRDTDVPEIAEPYHRYLVSYAVMRSLAKDEDYEAAAVYSQEYESGKQEISGHKVPISKDIDKVLELVRFNILNAAEAAEWLNLPMKKKVWQRVEVEEKGMALMQTGVIDKADLLENVEFTKREEIVDRLKQNADDFVPLPSWKEDKDGE